MRDFSDFGGVGSLRLLTLVGFDETGRPLVHDEEGSQDHACLSLIALNTQDIGSKLAATLIENTPQLLILGRIMPELPVAEIDGERLVLEADKEIVLRCGKSSITLKADGRVQVKGTQVLSRADGQNRVQGATVQLN